MKTTKVFLFVVVLLIAGSISAFAADDDFLVGVGWDGPRLGTANNPLDQWIHFSKYTLPSPHTLFTMKLASVDPSRLYEVYGSFVLSGSTLTLTVQGNGGLPNCPATIRATVNAAKTQITMPNPLGGGNIVFTKEGADVDSSPPLLELQKPGQIQLPPQREIDRNIGPVQPRR